MCRSSRHQPSGTIEYIGCPCRRNNNHHDAKLKSTKLIQRLGYISIKGSNISKQTRNPSQAGLCNVVEITQLHPLGPSPRRRHGQFHHPKHTTPRRNMHLAADCFLHAPYFYFPLFVCINGFSQLPRSSSASRSVIGTKSIHLDSTAMAPVPNHEPLTHQSDHLASIITPFLPSPRLKRPVFCRHITRSQWSRHAGSFCNNVSQ